MLTKISLTKTITIWFHNIWNLRSKTNRRENQILKYRGQIGGWQREVSGGMTEKDKGYQNYPCEKKITLVISMG